MPSRIKSNDRMTRSRVHLDAFVVTVKSLRSKPILTLMDDMSPESLFELMHSIRRWYSGQTMARRILHYREHLRPAMDIEPSHPVGVFRGFKVPKTHKLASVKPGDRISLPVTRNHGFSSWSTSEAPTHRFSGGGKGKVGLVVKLTSGKGIKPVLAPPHRSRAWFNRLYEATVCHGKTCSYRPTEDEYLIHAAKVEVQIVRVKR